MKQITSEVSLTFKASDGSEKTESAPVSYAVYETADDVLGFLTSAKEADLKSFLKSLNYGINLDARSEVRQTLQTKVAGPDKAVNKAVETLVKAMAALGVPFTEEQARAQIMANASKPAAA